MEKKRRFRDKRIMGVAVLLLAIGGVPLVAGKPKGKLECYQIPYSTSRIAYKWESEDYVVERETGGTGGNYRLTEKRGTKKTYAMERNPFNSGGELYHINGIKIDKERNIAYFLRMDMSGSDCEVIQILLDTMEEKVLYQSRDYADSARLFGMTIWKKIDSNTIKYDNVPGDFLVLNQALLLVKTGHVTFYDGSVEKEIVDFPVSQYVVYEDYFYFTNMVGELFYMNLLDFEMRAIDGVCTREIEGAEGGVCLKNYLDGQRYYYHVRSGELRRML